MQAHVKVKFPGEPLPEWIIIELQGSLECTSEENFKSKFIGDLHFTKQGIPVLIIGHSILQGKVVKIDKPLIAIKKSSQNSCEDNLVSVDYDILSIISKKILFKSRPKPITITEMKN